MRIAIFDAETRGPGTTALDRALAHFEGRAAARGDRCRRLRLASLRLNQCVGCFGCWVKTPGHCRLRDDGAQLVEAAADAELLVLASPLRMGFTNALLKRATDRLLPILLPYIDVVDGECHHRMRYGRGLDLALLVDRGADSATDAEWSAMLGIYRRYAKNLRGSLLWARTAADALEAREAPHALDAA